MSVQKIILKYLLLKIQNHDFIVGDLLPSAGKLGIQFNCNRHTASSSLEKLKNKRLVNFVPGVGHFLQKTFEQEINIGSYVSFSDIKSKDFDLNFFPLKLMSNLNINNIQKTFVKIYFLNKIHVAEQYIFINKEININIKENNIFQQLSYYGKTIHNIKKQIYLIDNSNSILKIQDQTLIGIKIQLLDADNHEIIKIYNLVSNKYFIANNNVISL